MATRIEGLQATPIQKAVGLTSLFQARLAETPKKPEASSAEEQTLQEKEKIC